MDSDPNSQPQYHNPYVQLQDQVGPYHPHAQTDSRKIVTDKYIPSQSRQDPYSQQGVFYEGSHNIPLPFNQTGEYASHVQVFNYDKAQILARIRSLEHRLDYGWFKCYSIWLNILIILACVELVQTIVYAVVQENVISFLLNFVCVFWVIYQSFTEIRAISLKRTSKAKRALIMMSIYTAINLGAVIFYLVWYGNFDNMVNNYNSYLQARQEYVLQVSIIFSIAFAAHVVTLIGAIKVYSVLKQRDTFSQEIEESDTL